MSAERLYRLLLRLYPADFRSEYGREMTLLFRDEYRTRDTTAIAFWVSMVWDAAHSAISMWVDVWLARGKEYTRTLEIIMKLAGTPWLKQSQQCGGRWDQLTSWRLRWVAPRVSC